MKLPFKSAKMFTRSLINRLLLIFMAYPERVQCNICGWSGRRFLSDIWHKHVLCPKCRLDVRHRLLLASFQHLPGTSYTRIIDRRSMLHFAPESFIRTLLQGRLSHYVTADYLRGDCALKLDMSAMPEIRDASFDVLIAMDVLEHVPDYRRALREVYRILTPGGVAIFTVPQKDNLAITYEDPSIVTAEERTKHFGQADHLRLFGDDFPLTIEDAGFSVTIVQAITFPEDIRHKNVLVPPLPSKHALATNYRKVFFCWKRL